MTTEKRRRLSDLMSNEYTTNKIDSESPVESSQNTLAGSTLPYSTPIHNRLPSSATSRSDDGVMDDHDDDRVYRGPSVILHRHDITKRAIQCIMILWFLSGFSFLTCVMLCVLVNVGYAAFHAKGTLTSHIIHSSFSYHHSNRIR